MKTEIFKICYRKGKILKMQENGDWEKNEYFEVDENRNFKNMLRATKILNQTRNENFVLYVEIRNFWNYVKNENFKYIKEYENLVIHEYENLEKYLEIPKFWSTKKIENF